MAVKSFVCGSLELPTASFPKSIYEQVQKDCRRLLIQHLVCAASPIEAPGKSLFDHIDFVATWPRAQGLDMHAVAAMMTSEPTIRLASFDQVSNSFTLAVPWPKEHHNFGLYTHKYVRVHVQLCPTLASMQWTLFSRAHDGLWGCIRSVIRPYGLVCQDNGLYLNIDEIHALDEDKSKIFLTSDPSAILKFLGLPEDRFWSEPFASVTEMHEYVTQCRMFCSRKGYPQGSKGKPSKEQARINDMILQCRPQILQTFLANYIPCCRKANKFVMPRTSPKKVMHEAVSYFNIGAEVQLRTTRVLTGLQRDYIVLYYINGGVPQIQDPADQRAECYRVCQVRALEEIVVRGETKYGIVPEHSLRLGDGQFDMPRVEEYIRLNMQRIGDAAYHFHSSWCSEVQRLLKDSEDTEQRHSKEETKKSKTGGKKKKKSRKNKKAGKKVCRVNNGNHVVNGNQANNHNHSQSRDQDQEQDQRRKNIRAGKRVCRGNNCDHDNNENNHVVNQGQSQDQTQDQDQVNEGQAHINGHEDDGDRAHAQIAMTKRVVTKMLMLINQKTGNRVRMDP